MKFGLPVQLQLKGRAVTAVMGPFSHSMEREFALTTSRKALKECNDPAKLKEIAGNLLEGWAMMNTALQGMTKENIELRQALAVRDSSLEAAEVLLNEAVQALQKYEKQSKKSKKGLWPWRR
jgi:hypothetical protein